jgi:lipoate-protein ligase A
MEATYKKDNCIIVLGIGGKPEELLNLQLVQQDSPLLVKRFTGGGTVVLTQDSLLTTIIGRNHLTPQVEPFPRSIMDFTASTIFKPTFRYMEKHIIEESRSPKSIQPLKSLVVEQKSCGLSSITAKALRFPSLNSTTWRTMKSHQQDPTIPKFALQEHDYVLGNHKIAGNAQSIIKGILLQKLIYVTNLCLVIN